MAYPVGKATVQHSNNSTTVVVTLPSHQDGDLLVLFLSQDGGGTNITESGTSAWTVVQPGSVTGAARMTLAYRYVASGAPVANPTFTGTAAEAWSVQKIVVRDADPTVYVAGTASATFTTNPAASPALSTVDADDAYGPILLLYAWCFDGAAMYCRALSNDLVELGKDMGDPQAVTDQTIASICGYRLQASYGAVPSLNAYAISTTEGGNSWVVAIKNKSGGVVAEDCRTGLIEGTAATTGVNWYGDFGAAHKAVTWVKPSDFISGTINSIATYTVAADSADVTTATRGAIAPWASYTVIRENDNLTTTFAGAAAWTGRGHTCSATDMSGKVFFVQWYASGSFATFLGSDGIIVAFKDGGGDWVSYQLRPKENIYNLEEVSSAIALGNATIYAASDGTGAAMDWTDVQGIGYFMHRLPGSTAIFDMAFKNACLMDSAVITGGSASIPASFTTLTSTLNSWGLGSTPIWGNHSPTSLQGAAQVLAKASVQIGDGTTPTYFDATAKAFTYPLTYSATSQPLWNVNANRATLNIKPSASDTINLTATGITTTNAQYLTIDAAASTSAAHAETGASIVGPWDVTWLTGYDCIGATFSGCDEINFKGADVTNCTITDTVSTDAAAAWDTSGATVDSCTIDGTGALYALELGASVTAITLTDCAITAGSTNKVHVLATTGTVTITISGSTSLSLLEVDDEGATVGVTMLASYIRRIADCTVPPTPPCPVATTFSSPARPTSRTASCAPCIAPRRTIGRAPFPTSRTACCATSSRSSGPPPAGPSSSPAPAPGCGRRRSRTRSRRGTASWRHGSASSRTCSSTPPSGWH